MAPAACSGAIATARSTPDWQARSWFPVTSSPTWLRRINRNRRVALLVRTPSNHGRTLSQRVDDAPPAKLLSDFGRSRPVGGCSQTSRWHISALVLALQLWVRFWRSSGRFFRPSRCCCSGRFGGCCVAVARKPPGKARFRRVVILGLDGLDHRVTEKMLAEGKLPHLAALRDQGAFKPLGSTLPPISPVAWSSFQTGVNPGKHNIFDFLTPDLRQLPAEAQLGRDRGPPCARIRLGPVPASAGQGRRATAAQEQPFWSVLGGYGIFNSMLRVPITFPPEKLRGVQLSAMCVPDLRGTQGMFSYYTTRPGNDGERTGGEVHRVRSGKATSCGGAGRPDTPVRTPTSGPLKLPFRVTITGGQPRRAADQRRQARAAARRVHRLDPGSFPGWLGRTVHGSVDSCCFATDPEFELYVTPINIDPGETRDADRLSQRSIRSIWPSGKGPSPRSGLAEDTWGLNEQVLDDEHFLQQCMRHRPGTRGDVLRRAGQGPPGPVRLRLRRHGPHPAHVLAHIGPVGIRLGRRKFQRRFARDRGPLCADGRPGRPHDGQVPRRRHAADGRLGPWLQHVPPRRRPEPLAGGERLSGRRRRERDKQHLAGVDWSQTRAFAIGLAGIFINLKGKLPQGIVEPGDEAEQLRDEIAARLGGLIDPHGQTEGDQAGLSGAKVYRGPYKEQAPDLIVGYASGYRVSWETAIGRTSRDVFHDNTKAWSGDHCVDPSLVPGVLFCNHKIDIEQRRGCWTSVPRCWNCSASPSPTTWTASALADR